MGILGQRYDLFERRRSILENIIRRAEEGDQGCIDWLESEWAKHGPHPYSRDSIVKKIKSGEI